MPTDPPQLDPQTLSLDALARVLTLAGGQRIDVDLLEWDRREDALIFLGRVRFTAVQYKSRDQILPAWAFPDVVESGHSVFRQWRHRPNL